MQRLHELPADILSFIEKNEKRELIYFPSLTNQYYGKKNIYTTKKFYIKLQCVRLTLTHCLLSKKFNKNFCK